jgi:AcrR family transcriptional regulator
MTDLKENKERLLEVAIDLFGARGFKGTSIRDIANTMGMSISNIYHYFGNKEGLLLAILQRSSNELLESLDDALRHSGLEPIERFKALLRRHLTVTHGRAGEAKIFALDEEHLTPEGNEINRRIQRRVLDTYVSELKALKVQDYVRCGDVTVAAFNILGVINWYSRWYRSSGLLSREEVVQEIISFVCHGILSTQED